ncbi:MAG: hypothetical protein ACE5FJ_00415 [Gemmatimonadales bacterium]
MLTHRFSKLGLLGVLILLMSCTDASGPALDLAEQGVLGTPLGVRRDLNVLRVPESADLCAAAVSRCSGGSDPGPVTASMWVVRGSSAKLTIYYEDLFGGRDDNSDGHPLLEFEVPPEGLAYYPGGTQFESGDSVLITVSLGGSEYNATFEPSGLIFSDLQPAELRFWYGQQGLDLNGDGIVDGEDQRIQQALGVWYQESGRDEWASVSQVHDSAGHRFSASVFHFSNYAVGW